MTDNDFVRKKLQALRRQHVRRSFRNLLRPERRSLRQQLDAIDAAYKSYIEMPVK